MGKTKQFVNDSLKALYWFQVIEEACNGDMQTPFRETLTVGNIISAHACGVMYSQKALMGCEQ